MGETLGHLFGFGTGLIRRESGFGGNLPAVDPLEADKFAHYDPLFLLPRPHALHSEGVLHSPMVVDQGLHPVEARTRFGTCF